MRRALAMAVRRITGGASICGATARVRSIIPGNCRITVRGGGNRVNVRGVHHLRGANIVVNGTRNVVEVDPGARVDGLRIVINGDSNRIRIETSDVSGVAMAISGSDNSVTIAQGCVIRSLGVVTEDDGNRVSIGAHTEIYGVTDLVAIEGTTILVGRGCLFSGGIHVRTGDSHSLTDLEGRRINPSQDITIGNHTWVGRSVTVLKGARVPDSSVIGASAVVTKAFMEPHCVIAGNPSKIVRRKVDWTSDRIGCD